MGAFFSRSKSFARRENTNFYVLLLTQTKFRYAERIFTIGHITWCGMRRNREKKTEQSDGGIVDGRKLRKSIRVVQGRFLYCDSRALFSPLPYFSATIGGFVPWNRMLRIIMIIEFN